MAKINTDYGAQAVTINQFVDQHGGSAIVSGCSASVGTNAMEVDVASGTARVNGTNYSITASTVLLDSANADYPRKDLVVVDNTGSVTKITGTAETAKPAGSTRRDTYRPRPDDTSGSSVAVIAEVWVGAGTSDIVSGDISDRRLLPLVEGFQDVDDDDVAELQNAHADFGGGDARNVGAFDASSARTDRLNNTESVEAGDRDIGTVIEAQPAGTLVIAENGTHNLTGTVTVPDGVGLHLRPGATIVAPDLAGSGEKVITFSGANQSLTGRGTIDGNQSGQSDLTVEGQAIVAVQGADNFYLNGPTMKNAPGGDCLYIGLIREGLVTNFVADGGYRNSVSIIRGRDYTVSNFLAMNAGGTAPETGLDIEPNNAGESLSRITVENFRVLNNADQGMQVHTKALNSGDDVDVTIRDGIASGNDDGFDFSRAFNGSPGIFAENLQAVDNTIHGFNIGAAGPLYLRDTVAKNNGSHNYQSDGTDTVAADNPIIENAHSISTGSTADRPANLRGSGTITLDGLRITGTYATNPGVATDSGVLDYQDVYRTDSDTGALQFPSRMTHLQERLKFLSQAGQPAPDDNEIVVWNDSDGASGDPTHYLVFTDENGSTVTFASEETYA